jgi:hypothetical protein
MFRLTANFGEAYRRDGLTGIFTSFLAWLDSPVLLFAPLPAFGVLEFPYPR